MSGDYSINMVLLTNGEREPEPVVKAVMVTLKGLASGRGIQDPIVAALALCELVSKARDSKHELWHGTGRALAKLAIFQDDKGKMSSSIRNIVLSAFKDQDLEHLAITDPMVRWK